MVRHRSGFTMIELVVVVAIISVLIALLLPAVQSAREAARRTQCTNNLTQLGIAIENYEATNLVLPPGVVDRVGPVVETPTSYQFGWICQILPYLEQKTVYKRLDFASGIYTTNNLTARSVTMYVLLCPSDGRRSGWGNRVQNFGVGPSNAALMSLPDPASTAYAACHNDVEAPIDANNNGVFFLNSRVRLDEIEDGLAHTIFLGEKTTPGDELGWASGTRATLRNTGTPINQTFLDPSNLTLFLADLAGVDRPANANENVPAPDPNSPPAAPVALGPIPVGGFGSSHPLGANFLFGDGSVHFLRTTMNARVFRLLGNRRDGEPIGDDRF
jgi:prepilin-type N-terminal cleavage/methylation domain-containing protein/prepilin-type processing-associated H-X9-DG protein